MPAIAQLETYRQTVETCPEHEWPSWVAAIYNALVLGNKADMLRLAERNEWMIKVYNALIADLKTYKADSE